MRKLSIVSLLLVACSSSGVPSPTDGGVGPRPSGCPDTPPTQDSACDQNGLLCEYGDDYNPLCNDSRVCSSGRWASPVTFGGSKTCPGAPPKIAPNPSDCAPNRSGVPVGQACSSSSTCAYDGAQCSCIAFCPSFPVAQQDCDSDLGIVSNCCDRSKVAWHCFEGPSYCPTPRPRLGTSCSMAGQECALEAPGECGQTRLVCQNGAWAIENDSCPISNKTEKREISYLAPDAVEQLHNELMRVRLATFRYKRGDETQHLGFVIEDMPAGSPAVSSARDHVDLYGYVSMAVATLQRQEREIAALKAEIAELKARRKR